MRARQYPKRKCDLNNLNVGHFAQYRVTIVKTITACWLFILQPIKAIQLVKSPEHAILLKRD